jgi:hypothetical protein
MRESHSLSRAARTALQYVLYINCTDKTLRCITLHIKEEVREDLGHVSSAVLITFLIIKHAFMTAVPKGHVMCSNSFF